MCQPECLLGLEISGTGAWCLWCLLQITESVSFNFHYLHRAVICGREFSLCCRAWELLAARHPWVITVQTWSKPLSFNSFADLLWHVWSIENHSVHHCVCTAVKGGDLVCCGNSCLQDRSCEIAQESRCAIEQERRYSSLGHLHQKEREWRTWAQCASVMDYVQPHAGEDHRTQESLLLWIISSSKGTPGQWDELGLGCLWLHQCIFHCHWKDAPSASGCRALCWSGFSAAGSWLRLWWQSRADSLARGVWHSACAGFWRDYAFQQLFEPCG